MVQIHGFPKLVAKQGKQWLLVLVLLVFLWRRQLVQQRKQLLASKFHAVFVHRLAKNDQHNAAHTTDMHHLSVICQEVMMGVGKQKSMMVQTVM